METRRWKNHCRYCLRKGKNLESIFGLNNCTKEITQINYHGLDEYNRNLIKSTKGREQTLPAFWLTPKVYFDKKFYFYDFPTAPVFRPRRNGFQRFFSFSTSFFPPFVRAIAERSGASSRAVIISSWETVSNMHTSPR